MPRPDPTDETRTVLAERLRFMEARRLLHGRLSGPSGPLMTDRQPAIEYVVRLPGRPPQHLARLTRAELAEIEAVFAAALRQASRGRSVSPFSGPSAGGEPA